MSTSVQSSTKLTQAVDQIRNEHVTAVNSGDVEAAAGLFAPEGVFLPPGSPAIPGRDAIRQWFTGMFAQFSLQGFALEPDGVEERGDVLIEHGSWKATFTPRGRSQGVPGGGTYFTIYGRVPEGSVRVLYDTFNGLPG